MKCPDQRRPYAECTCARRHVHCDDNCGAFEEPVTLEEFRAALIHWKNHGVSSGCSHGN